MARELKIAEVEEKGADVTEFKWSRKPYKAALNREWRAMVEFFKKCDDERLLDSLTVDGDTTFHIAAYSGKAKVLQQLLDLVPEERVFEALSKRNAHGNTILHEVATTDKVEAAKLLIRELKRGSRLDKVQGRNVARLKELLEYRNELGETPLYRAVALGQTKMAKFLAMRVQDIRDHFYRYDNMSILQIAVIGQHFETASWLLVKDKTLATEKGANGMTCLHLLAKMPSAFRSSVRLGTMERFFYSCLPSYPSHHNDYDEDDDDSICNETQRSSSTMKDLESGRDPGGLRESAISRIYYAIWKGLAEESRTIKRIWKMKTTHKPALKLMDLLVKMDTTWAHSFKAEAKTVFLGKADSLGENVDEGMKGKGTKGGQLTTEESEEERVSEDQRSEGNQETYTPLLIAASEGILEIFDKMIEEHPQAIEHISMDEENILHVAISYRQREIFRRVKKMKTIMDCRLVSKIDKAGYTILHHVADMKNYSGGTKAGPALQLQEELKWLERVRKIIPSHYEMHRNNANQIAGKLFETTHTDLLKNAQRWAKDTSQSCSAVAVLVATVVFAAAYTVPGGNDSSGLPVFLDSPFFLFFTVMDVISLASSLTSVVTFLSVLTSPFELNDFRTSIPRKLMIGFTLLFFSVTTTMLAFMATILLIIRYQKRRWTTTLIYTAAFLPVAVFALMQFPLYVSFTSGVHSLLKKIIKKVPGLNLLPRLFKTSKRKIY